MAELNQRLTEKNGQDDAAAIKMSRFRPNIVIDGVNDEPFAEDSWKVIAIGNDKVLFHVVKGCPRCKQSCIDQTTGEVHDEPLATLKTFRACQPGMPDNVYFCQNLIPDPSALGQTIRVGDAVTVLKRGAPVWEKEA